MGDTTYTLTQANLPTTDNSFTLSYSLNIGNWAFFHDYIPDMYFYTRDQLYAISNNETQPVIYQFNSGNYGQYIKNITNSFFIDLVFVSGVDTLLNTITWITKIIDANSNEIEFKTITHISIWNTEQHSGRIPLEQFFKNSGLDFYASLRKTKGSWTFNDFRDILLERGVAFLDTIFNDFNLKPNLKLANAWYEKQRMQDIYFVIRFEYDNIDNNTIILHEQITNKIVSNR